jgi:hypothetical protein
MGEVNGWMEGSDSCMFQDTSFGITHSKQHDILTVS